MNRKTQLTALVTVALVVLVVPTTVAMGGGTFDQTNDLTETQTDTTTTVSTTASSGSSSVTEEEDTCDPRAGGPKLQKARLHSPESTITEGEHGTIAATIALDIQNECDVIVQITMSIPSGMYVAGAGDLSSGGGGIITSTFEVRPGEVKSLRGNVYSNSLGEKTVTADITYFPVGHKDMASEIDGIMLSFDVQGEYLPDDPQPPTTASTTTTTITTTTTTTTTTTATTTTGGGNWPFDNLSAPLIGVLLLFVIIIIITITKAQSGETGPDALLEWIRK